METYKEYTLQYERTKDEVFKDGIITDNLHWKKDLKEVKKALKNRLTQLEGLLNGYVNQNGTPKAGITAQMITNWKLERDTLHIVEHTVTISDPVAYEEGK